MRSRALSRYAWGILGYNILVILWGAFVRATGSGAGCGRHWPDCNGAVIPRADSVETLIEFSHRLTSGIALLGVVALLIWAVRVYPRAHRVRKAAIASMIFMVLEALVGAALVLFELVATNASLARAVVIAVHLVNTFGLLAALTLTAWWASGGHAIQWRQAPLRFRLSLMTALGGMLILGASGAITALGDTLLLKAGLLPEDSALLATLMELRFSHPVLAVGVGLLIGLTVYLAHSSNSSKSERTTGHMLLALYGLQLGLGAINVILKAPVWIQIVHLLLADLIWIGLILLAAQRLSVPSGQSEHAQPPAVMMSSSH